MRIWGPSCTDKLVPNPAFAPAGADREQRATDCLKPANKLALRSSGIEAGLGPKVWGSGFRVQG